jgi:threonylcarbamoyladenosine tRNA methylthiotransferase MtaB
VVANRRAAELGELCKRLHHEFCAAAVGQETEVLFESTMRGGMMFGYTGNYIRVKSPYRRDKINQICRVKLVSISEDDDLLAEILD